MAESVMQQSMHTTTMCTSDVVSTVTEPAGQASKALAMCFFDFNKEDVQAACNYQRTLKGEWKSLSNEALLKLLPLKTWKRTVRRTYLPAEVQSARLNQWYETYITNEGAFVDTSVAGQARPLVRGGAEGKQKFDQMFQNQLQLVHKGMLSGEYTGLGLGRLG